MPPLRTSLTKRGRAPLQKVRTPSCLRIMPAQRNVLPYMLLASGLCMRVLRVSRGCVTNTVTKPANPPMAKVPTAPSFSPGAVYDSAICLKNVYDPKRVALLADWRRVVGTKPWKKPRIPRSRAMIGTAWRKPRIRGLAAFLSSMLSGVVSVPLGARLSIATLAYSVVLILSVGVTASNDSVTPAPKPARTVRGPVSLPLSSARSRLYWSKATKPREVSAAHTGLGIDCSHTNTGLCRVSDDQSRASSIPLTTEWWPRQLLSCRQPPI